jgi:hypothetical protein
MPHFTEVLADAGIVRLVLTGDVTLEQIHKASEDCWRLANREGLNRFLTEFKDVILDLSTADLLNIHKHYEKIGISKDIRSAIVVPDNIKIAEDAMIHEFVAGASAWQVKVFYGRSEALDWLRG